MIIKNRPYLINWSGNAIYYQFYSANSLADKTVILEASLWFKRTDENVFRELANIPLIPDATGHARINWQTVLHSVLQFGMPDISVALSQGCNTQTGSFYIQYRERSDALLEAPWSAEEQNNVLYVVKGGVPDNSFRNNAFWFNYFPTVKPFLTWQIKGRLVAPDEKMFLAWLHPFKLNGAAFNVVINVYYTDRSKLDKTITFVSTPGKVQYIPSGFLMLSLDTLNPNKKAWYWTIQVYDNTIIGSPEIASELFSFEIDNRTDYNNRQLIYRVSMGGLETVRVRGVIEQQQDYDLQESSQPKIPYYEDNWLQPTENTLPAAEVVSWKGDIGYLPKEEQERLRDMLLIREAYQVDGQRILPVNLLTKSFLLNRTADKRWSFPVEWKMAHEGSNYYQPEQVDVGDGKEHACTCIIRQATFARAFEADNTICKITWALIVYCPDTNSHEYRLQYKINGVTEWVEIPYTDSTYPVTTHPAGIANIDVLWRVVCPEGGVGDAIIKSVNTLVVGSGSDGTPNSRLSWSASRPNLGIGLICNNVSIPIDPSKPDRYEVFYVADGMTTVIVSSLLIDFATVQLISNGVTYVPVRGRERSSFIYTFNDVNVINGIQISVS